jgi:hypothetical protein
VARYHFRNKFLLIKCGKALVVNSPSVYILGDLEINVLIQVLLNIRFKFPQEVLKPDPEVKLILSYVYYVCLVLKIEFGCQVLQTEFSHEHVLALIQKKGYHKAVGT